MITREHWRSLNLGQDFIGVSHQNWSDFTPVIGQPELLSQLVKENPLVLVHPGFGNFSVEEIEAVKKIGDYQAYLKRLNKRVKKAEAAGQSIIMFTPTDYRLQTLEQVYLPEIAILIPTFDTGILTNSQLLNSQGNLFKPLCQSITRAEICGEYGLRCLFGIALKFAEQGIKLQPLDDQIFPSDYRSRLTMILKVCSMAKESPHEYRLFNREELLEKAKNELYYLFPTTYHQVVNLNPAFEDSCWNVIQLPDQALDILSEAFGPKN